MVNKILDPFYYTEQKNMIFFGGGDAPDTSGLEKATQAATDLQRQIYTEGREDIQPWYQMGVGATGKLSDLLGISGGSVLSREDIYSELLPQYTSQGTSGGMYVAPDGSIVSSDYLFENMSPFDANRFKEGEEILVRTNNKAGLAPYETYTPFQGSEKITDYDALNAAVEARLAEQGQTPEGFGSLLERFDETKFQDSAGRQFREEQGQKALERAMAAQGVTLGGAGYGEVNAPAAQALMDYSQGLASQEYQNEYNRYVNDQLNTFNMLMGASGSGQQATNQLAQQGQVYATNVGNLQTGLASAQYQAEQASASRPSMFGSLLGMGAGALLGNPSFGAAIGRGIFG